MISQLLTDGLPCWLEVDFDAVAANVAALRRWIGPNTSIAAVVKAQAYGVGAEEIAGVALAAGASWLAVARMHEAIELRCAGVRAPILVLNRTDLVDADDAVRYQIAVTVDRLDLARALDQAARRHGRLAQVHVKVDTGLHRFGVGREAALPFVRALSEMDGLSVSALYTHFASADEADPGFTQEQFAAFDRLSAELASSGYRFPMRHSANSAATLAFPETHLSLVRLGLSLYGTSPSGSVPPGLVLRPAISLRARISRLMQLPTGDGVGYGQTWSAQRPSQVALVSAGYADGISRHLSNRGTVLVCGQRAPIVGRVSMDLTTVDVTDVQGVTPDSVVTFIGEDGGESAGGAEITLTEFADAADTIPHDALCGVGGRVARVYLRNGAVEKTVRLNGTRRVAPSDLVREALEPGYSDVSRDNPT